jgi:hypothetical protein
MYSIPQPYVSTPGRFDVEYWLSRVAGRYSRWLTWKQTDDVHCPRVIGSLRTNVLNFTAKRTTLPAGGCGTCRCSPRMRWHQSAPTVLLHPPPMATPESEHPPTSPSSQPDQAELSAILVLRMLAEAHYPPPRVAFSQAPASSGLMRFLQRLRAGLARIRALPGHAVWLAWTGWRAVAVLGQATVRRLGHEHRDHLP